MPVESPLAIQAALETWYRANARRLPWRQPPGQTQSADPYRVWLSEIMLQQTTVAAVTPYYERFVARWPTVAALAAADPADVLAAWAGLGYYSRARNLIACARIITDTHAGQFPDTVSALKALPGIGDYTAAAIVAIGHGGGAVPIDANVARVVARLHAIDTPLPAARAAIRDAAHALWPAIRAGDFAQALMDLGSAICTARLPDCAVCPLSEHCAAHAAGVADRIPAKDAKKAKPVRHGRVNWLELDGAVWLVRRPPSGLLGGMRALPGGSWTDTLPPPVPDSVRIGTVRHIFTHFILELAIDRPLPAAATALAVGEGEWWPLTRLDEAGLPTLYRRAATLALGES